MISIKFKKLHPEAKLPQQMTSGSLGLDLFAHLLDHRGQPSKQVLPPNNVRLIPTGLAIEPPQRNRVMASGPHVTAWQHYRDQVVELEPIYLVQVVSRSGLAKDYHIFVANAPGIIDPDYRGELKVLLYNGGPTTQYVQHGMRIAQLILVRSEYAQVVEVEELSASDRGNQGFGSTGR